MVLLFSPTKTKCNYLTYEYFYKAGGLSARNATIIADTAGIQLSHQFISSVEVMK